MQASDSSTILLVQNTSFIKLKTQKQLAADKLDETATGLSWEY